MADKSKNKKPVVTPEQEQEITRDIFAETQAAFEKAGFTVDRMAEEYAIMAFSDPANHSEISEGGELQFKTFEEQGKNRRAIRKLKEKTVITESKDGEQLYKTSTVEYELYDKKIALDVGMMATGRKAPEKLDVNITGDLGNKIFEARERAKNASRKKN